MLVSSKSWGPMIKMLEIKPLCDLILQTTISDQDKYQSGLTKIFFRAGMLAAMESLRSERLNGLVTIVQKNMRRRMAVKRYQEMRKAAIIIQTWWRGVMAKILVEKIRREVAARRLQTAVRCFVQRQLFLAVRRAVVGLQSREHISVYCTWLTESRMPNIQESGVCVRGLPFGTLGLLLLRRVCRVFSGECT